MSDSESGECAARDEALDEADFRTYWRFTGPQRLDKALHALEGLLRGIAADGHVTDTELRFVRGWVDEYHEFADRHPFNEVIPFLDDVLRDRAADREEAQDILWLCDRLSPGHNYFAAVTSDLQRLQGMLGGVVADGKITAEELRSLSAWADEHEPLAGCWPFDELRSVILGVLKDGRVDADEHRMLLALFQEFMAVGEHRAVDLPLNEMVAPIQGFCAVCPEVSFGQRSFCFTGKSKRATRRELADLIERLGGSFSPSVRADLHYLIIGADGNPAWAFSCYGRKVEQAMEHRKQGRPLVLVHEFDFWDAVAEVDH